MKFIVQQPIMINVYFPIHGTLYDDERPSITVCANGYRICISDTVVLRDASTKGIIGIKANDSTRKIKRTIRDSLIVEA